MISNNNWIFSGKRLILNLNGRSGLNIVLVMFNSTEHEMYSTHKC